MQRRTILITLGGLFIALLIAVTTGWDKEPPAPELPADVVEKTREKYLDAYRQLTGSELET